LSGCVQENSAAPGRISVVSGKSKLTPGATGPGPWALVCDEVTSALDVSVQAVIVELLRAVTARRHLAMIFITHNLALVRSVAQSVVVLRHGRIVEAGPARQVLASPASEYTARLMADVPRLARPGAGL